MKSILMKIGKGDRMLKNFSYILLSLFLLAGIVSCEKLTLPPGPPTSGIIILDKDNIEMTVGDRTTLSMSLEDGKSFVKKFSASSSNPEIVGIERVDGYTVRVLGRQVGSAVVTFTSDDGEVELTCEVTVNEVVSDGITRILAIGNSFSEDALEAYLHSIATTAGDSVIIANMYIGGSSLEQHLTNAQENNNAYSYRKIDKYGVKTTVNEMTLEEVLNDELWDYISFQQASHFSGQYPTYEASLPELYKYVKEKVVYTRTKYVFHQTWAYAQNSTHSGFANYGNDQMTMYNAIVDAVQKATNLVDFDLVVPAGTAIQNGRTTFWGDNFTRDGYHLDLNIGRYVAACTWYEAIFGKSVIGNTYDPGSFMLTDIELEMGQHAAHAAILNPYQITEMVDYKSVDLDNFTSTISVDIAQTQPADGWNGLTSPVEGTIIPYLRDQDGNLTEVSLEITERFNNVNFNGEQNTNTPLNMPSSVSGSSYFGNTKASFGGLLVLKSVMKISGLDPSKLYDFCFFGSRSSNEGRETKYITKGQNEVASTLMVGSNSDKIACNEGIQPDADGNIFVTVTAGERNDNGTGFYYLNAMRISVQ
ncbi:DUF4886 domain-containing protein [Albibacterium profundi]|uniref:DUF4886 domain-containing protein n=1 Tax=Albibacterium profundi TaxID=3134906 RepID=A0ABV5CAM3_9SPHI